jgi:hypothetical protein
MKSLRICGWAVIFTVTFLLAACASHDPRVADSDVMSGPDATMSQTINQEYEDSAIFVSQDWLDAREAEVEQRELDLVRHEDSAIIVSQDWLDEREMMVEQRELDLLRNENALVIEQAWLNERESQLDMRTGELDRRENALAINQAWLDERETRLAHKAFDLTSQDNMQAFRDTWLDERETHVGIPASGGTPYVKLAGADSTATEETARLVKVESGRCYASVVFPAEYKTVAVVKPIEVPKGENLPVLYQTVTEKVKVTDEQTRWEEVLCAQEMTDCRIFEIQRSLTRGGYNPGPIDGIAGRQTMAAVKSFQKDFNLTVTDHLTIETVNALDANF